MIKSFQEHFLHLLFTKTAKDTGVLFLGNTIASIFAVIFTILGARMLGPEQWGIAAAVISFVVIAEAVGDLGLGSALFRFVSRDWAQGKQEQARRTLSNILVIRLASAVLLFGVLSLSSPLLSKIVLKTDNNLYIVLGAASVLAYLLLDFQILSFQAKQQWAKASFFSATTNILRIIFVVWLAFSSNLTVTSILLAFALSPLLTLFATLLLDFPKIAFRSSKETDQVINFSGWLGINRIASATGGRIDTILVLSLLGAYETGIFSAAKQLSIGVPLIVGSIAAVLAPRFATLTNENLSAYFKKAVYLSTGVGLVILIGVFVSPLIVQFLGDKYIPSVRVLQLLLVGYVPFAISIPAINILIYSYGKSKIIAWLSITQLVFIVTGNYLLIPTMGLNGPILMHGIWNTVSMVVAYTFAHAYLKGAKK